MNTIPWFQKVEVNLQKEIKPLSPKADGLVLSSYLFTLPEWYVLLLNFTKN